MRAVPAMRKQQDGCIINVASWAGRHVSKMPGPAYTTTKHAVLALTHSFNMDECVNGLHACCLSPGEVATPILKLRPARRASKPNRRRRPQPDPATIAFVASMPPRVCINEILISPTHNAASSRRRLAVHAALPVKPAIRSAMSGPRPSPGNLVRETGGQRQPVGLATSRLLALWLNHELARISAGQRLDARVNTPSAADARIWPDPIAPRLASAHRAAGEHHLPRLVGPDPARQPLRRPQTGVSAHLAWVSANLRDFHPSQDDVAGERQLAV